MFQHQDVGENNNIYISNKSFEMAQQNSYTCDMRAQSQNCKVLLHLGSVQAPWEQREICISTERALRDHEDKQIFFTHFIHQNYEHISSSLSLSSNNKKTKPTQKIIFRQ
jgi:hypothetical protein